MGCDYCSTIKGIGPKRAIDLIKQHSSIEEILENIDPNVSWWLLQSGSWENWTKGGFSSDSLCLSCAPSCRSILLQRTGCTKRPGVCFWNQKWWIAPQWSWSGASQMRMDWSSSCVMRNSSGEPSADSSLVSSLLAYWVWWWRMTIMTLIVAVILWPLQLVIRHLTTRLHCWLRRGGAHVSGISGAENFFTYDMKF